MLNKPEELEVLPPATETTSKADLFDSSEASSRNDDDALIEGEGDPAFAPIHNARRVPVYRKLGPFQTKRLREIMHTVLAHLDRSTVADDLPAELLKRQDLISRSQAIAEIHFPPDDSSIADYEMFRSAAHKRLIFDEFFWLSFTMQLLRGERLKEPKGTVIEIT
jgi:ATP-dependent DNA helicase RecG